MMNNGKKVDQSAF
jgi:hypothetical protein